MRKKCNIQFRLVPYIKGIKECLLSKFDKTTTSKFQKKYNEYAEYWSKKNNLVENRYCGS